MTGYDAATGKISYSYQEDGTANTHNATNDNVKDSFAVVVTDNLNAVASDSLDIQILDTTPVAVGEAHTLTEDAATSSVSGAALTGFSVSIAFG